MTLLVKLNIIITKIALALPVMLFTGQLKAQEFVHEKVFVHTARNIFHSGEIMYFSISLFEASTGEISELSKVVYVQLIDSADKPAARAIISVHKGRGSGSFVIPDIKPGVFRIVAFSSWMKNFSPENYFQKNIAIINARISNKTFIARAVTGTQEIKNDFVIQLKTGQISYGKRKAVDLDITSLDIAGKPLPSNFSISVYRLDSLTGIDIPNRDLSEYKDEAITTSIIKYTPEFRERWISGMVTYGDNNLPASGIKLYVTLPGYASGFNNGVTNSDGTFRIAVREIIPTSSVIVQAATNDGIKYNIKVDDPFLTLFPARLEGEFIESMSNPLSLIEASINAQVGISFNADLLQHYITVSPDTVPFFGRADFVYRLDDYTRFSKMEEVFREYIGPVAVNKRDNRFKLSVYELQTHNTFNHPPLILLDGYPVDDINQLFLFDPLKVKTIEVVNRKYTRAGEMFYGIVNMITYSHDLNGYKPSPGALILPDHVVQRRRQFVSPQYDSPASRQEKLPDFRSLLYWSPSVSIDSSGRSKVSFWTSDLPGEYVVIVHAISGSKSTSAFTKFTVLQD